MSKESWILNFSTTILTGIDERTTLTTHKIALHSEPASQPHLSSTGATGTTTGRANKRSKRETRSNVQKGIWLSAHWVDSARITTCWRPSDSMTQQESLEEGWGGRRVTSVTAHAFTKFCGVASIKGLKRVRRVAKTPLSFVDLDMNRLL